MTKLLKKAGIYVLRKCNSSKCYVGKDHNLGKRARQHLALKNPSCRAIYKAIKKYGADAFDVELIPYPNISHEALYAVEKWKIKQLGSHGSQGGYNLTWGGDGFDPETAREVARKTAQKRLADGTHHFLDSDFQRENQLKRVADGTNPFLGGEIARENQLKQLSDGTHNFLDKAVSRRGHYVHRMKRKAQRRELYRIYATILTAKSVCEERIYRKRIREGFFDVEIPDTSNAEQQEVSFD